MTARLAARCETAWPCGASASAASAGYLMAADRLLVTGGLVAGWTGPWPGRSRFSRATPPSQAYTGRGEVRVHHVPVK
jgi:hypothetical protein